jgi:hypothetical protein
LAAQVQKLGMPPSEALERFRRQAQDASKLYSALFEQALADLRSQKKDLWDERENPFSEDEIAGLVKKFETRVQELRDAALSDFEAQVWRHPRQMKRSSPLPEGEQAERGSMRTKAGRILDSPYPGRASWLDERLRERGWNKHNVQRERGPDHKTIQKILDGKHVREDVLEKLAGALSKKKAKVDLLDIPPN